MERTFLVVAEACLLIYSDLMLDSLWRGPSSFFLPFFSSFFPIICANLPCCSSQHPHLCQYPGFILPAPPPKPHRRCQIMGGLPSKGDTVLLLSHFSGVQRCLFCLNIGRSPSAMPPTDNSVTHTQLLIILETLTYPGAFSCQSAGKQHVQQTWHPQ